VIILLYAQSLSNPLQEGIRLFHPLCPTFPNALQLWFYPVCLLETVRRERRAYTFRINNTGVSLGLSCLPAEQHPCKHCVKRA